MRAYFGAREGLVLSLVPGLNPGKDEARLPDF